MFTKKSLWHQQQQLYRYNISDNLRDWLLFPASMTKRMQQHLPPVRISLLTSKRCLLSHAQAQLLNVPPRTSALIREVHMFCNNQPWLFGRTILPQPSLNGKLRRIQTLGTIPLGKLLFRFPTTHRGPFEISQIHPTQGEYQQATRTLELDKQAPLIARRSLFTLDGNNAHLTEIFLPAMQAYINGTP